MRAYYRRPGAVCPAPVPVPAPGNGPKKRRALLFFLLSLAILAAAVAGCAVYNAVTANSGSGGSTGSLSVNKSFVAPTIARADTGGDLSLTLSSAGTADRLSFQEIYEKNIASIVSVYVSDNNTTAGLGTGVVLTQDGYIVTNAHVVSGMALAYVTTYEGDTLEAKLVGCDEYTDLAVLKVDPDTPLSPAEFGDSSTLQVGDTALALGNPLGTELWGTMTNGIISAINRDVDMGSYSMTLIQTTAALNSGSSGGMLLNNCGQVVGITNMKLMSDDNTIEGLGFAIPSTTLKAVAESLAADGEYRGTPSIGIVGYASQDPSAPGVVVYQVTRGSGAYTAGLQLGDRIVAVNDTPVSTVEEINDVKSGLKIGDKLELTVVRPGTGETLNVSVALVGSYDLDS